MREVTVPADAEDPEGGVGGGLQLMTDMLFSSGSWGSCKTTNDEFCFGFSSQTKGNSFSSNGFVRMTSVLCVYVLYM